MHFIVTANYNNKTNCFEAHTHTYKTGKTMKKVIKRIARKENTP